MAAGKDGQYDHCMSGSSSADGVSLDDGNVEGERTWILSRRVGHDGRDVRLSGKARNARSI